MVICVLYPRFELLAALGDRGAAPRRAGRAGARGWARAGGGGGVGAGRGLRSRPRHEVGGGACALSRPPSGASRSRGIALPVGSRARPARGDRRGRGVGSLGGGLLRRAAARGHPRRSPRGGARGRPPRARAGVAPRRGAQPLRGPRGGAPGTPPPASRRAAAPPGRSWWRSGRRVTSSLPCRCRSCAPGQSCRRSRRSSSSSGSGRSASSPRSPHERWPSGSATRGSWRSTWPGAATPSSSRGGRPSRSASGSTCPRRSRPPARACPGAARGQGARPPRAARALLEGARHVRALRGRRHLAARGDAAAASADPARIRLALAPRLAELPAPAESLALEVEAFGPPAHDQERLLDEGGAVRRARLGEAVRQARQAAGADAALRVLDVDPDSRIPERRAVLAPFPDWPVP